MRVAFGSGRCIHLIVTTGCRRVPNLVCHRLSVAENDVYGMLRLIIVSMVDGGACRLRQVVSIVCVHLPTPKQERDPVKNNESSSPSSTQATALGGLCKRNKRACHK